jgi:hypothetical protein
MGPPAQARASAALPTACERLVLSRERLRRALPQGSAAAGGTTWPGSGAEPGGGLPAWLSNLAALPGAGIVIDAWRAWWAKHPLRVAGEVGVEAVRSVLQPIARSHPLALVLGALLLGGVLAATRPWRWILKPAWFAGLWPQLFLQNLSHHARSSAGRPGVP